MRRIAVIAAALMVAACSSTTNQPVPSSPSAPPTSASPTPAAAALDCTKPANAAQQLACTDSHIFDLERQMQIAFRQALASPGADQSALSAAQNTWATARDDCARNADVHTCVLEAYQTRLVQL